MLKDMQRVKAAIQEGGATKASCLEMRDGLGRHSECHDASGSER